MNGSRILLVEDDEDIGTDLAHALSSHGHSARLARSGGEALSAATAEQPDLVLLDLGLPDIDGWRCAAACAPSRPTESSWC